MRAEVDPIGPGSSAIAAAGDDLGQNPLSAARLPIGEVAVAPPENQLAAAGSAARTTSFAVFDSKSAQARDAIASALGSGMPSSTVRPRDNLYWEVRLLDYVDFAIQERQALGMSITLDIAEEILANPSFGPRARAPYSD